MQGARTKGCMYKHYTSDFSPPGCSVTVSFLNSVRRSPFFHRQLDPVDALPVSCILCFRRSWSNFFLFRSLISRSTFSRSFFRLHSSCITIIFISSAVSSILLVISWLNPVRRSQSLYSEYPGKGSLTSSKVAVYMTGE